MMLGILDRLRDQCSAVPVVLALLLLGRHTAHTHRTTFKSIIEKVKSGAPVDAVLAEARPFQNFRIR